MKRTLRVTALSATTAGLVLASVAAAMPAAAESIQAKQWYLSKLGVRSAWSATRGSSVLVGIVDSGVAGAAVDLRGAVAGGKDFSGLGSANGQTPVGIESSHGTNVASVLAGRGHGAGHRDGVIGVAPAAKIVTASVNDSSVDTPTQVAAAIRWLVDQHVRVINLSVGGPSSAALTSALSYAQARDVVVVASAGNDGTTPINAMAASAGEVAVSGVDADLRLDPASNRGRGIALAGPFSTRATDPASGGVASLRGGLPVANPPGDVSGPYTLSAAGTSLAAPIVAGVAALIRSRFPSLNAANVINRLLQTATPQGSGHPNNEYGYGVVNAERAVTASTASVGTVTTNPLGSLNPVPASSPPASSPASTPPASTAPLPSSSAPGPSGTSSGPSTGPSTAASSSTNASGIGAGEWVAIAAVAVVAALLIGVLVARDRRRRRGPAGMPTYPRR